MNAAATAYTDQLDAAAREAEHITRLIGDQLDNATQDGDCAPITAIFCLHTVTITLGGGLACEHVDYNRPAPRFAVAHLPGRETCLSCTPLLRPDPEEDHRCDLCRRDVPPNEMNISVGCINGLIISAGFCDTCLGKPRARLSKGRNHRTRRGRRNRRAGGGR